ncbi:MAG: methylated-DNA--[protein]-cysteine S-methyltransferase [Acidobacteriia bacterium]|nr:methylated-DNA--[protein]-cysteine S-methyltransferase [Terriglobia bacterium]
METLYYSTWQSPIGSLTLVASDRGLVALEFRPELRRKSKATWLYSDDKLAPYRRELEKYFAGELRHFTMPLDLRGTEFQMRCWQALLKIPYGETRTYAEQARAIGQPKAFRAVGMANHDNPIAIVVPCHRVIASDGKLGGYGGGLPLKQKLLDLERGQGTLGSARRVNARPPPRRNRPR